MSRTQLLKEIQHAHDNFSHRSDGHGAPDPGRLQQGEQPVRHGQYATADGWTDQVASNSADQSTTGAAAGSGSTEASASYDAAVSKAQSDNRNALAKCDAMSGDAAKTCRDEANAALQSAMDEAQATRGTTSSPQG